MRLEVDANCVRVSSRAHVSVHASISWEGRGNSGLLTYCQARLVKPHITSDPPSPSRTLTLTLTLTID